MTAEVQPRTWRTLLAFGIIYFAWGSTFLFIRMGVQEIPFLLFAAMRFCLAGLVLYVWMLARGERSPTRREWLSTLLLATLIFVFDYGLLFWAEQFVPSGVAAVLMATIPAFMALSEIVLLGTQQATLRLAVALLIGMMGVAVLVSRSLALGGAPVSTSGAIGLIIAAMSWSVASALTRKLPLPSSKVMTSGAQMLVGGVMLLLISAASGQVERFHPASVSRGGWFALAYLIVVGSIIGFTAYTWLLHHESPTKVGTYAYVNPIVAVLLGYFAAGEPLGLRTVLGTACVLVSVVVITTSRQKRPVAALAVEDSAAP